MIVITTVRPGSQRAAQAAVLGRARRRQAEAEQQDREREQDVDHAGDHRVHPAAEEAGDHAHRHADRHRQAGADERDQQRHPRAVEDAREDVATERVDAEEVLAARARTAARSRRARRCCRRSARGAPRMLRISGAKIADQDQQDDERARRQRDLVLAEAAPEELQRRPRSHRPTCRRRSASTPLSSACSRSLAPVPVLKSIAPSGGLLPLLPRTGQQTTPCAPVDPLPHTLPAALVAQWIEHAPPKRGMQVRFLPGAFVRCACARCHPGVG